MAVFAYVYVCFFDATKRNDKFSGIFLLNNSILIFLLGMVTVYILAVFEDSEIVLKKPSQFWAIIMLIIAYVFIVIPYKDKIPTLYQKQVFENTPRWQVQKLKSEYALPDGKKYIFYSSAGENEYIGLVMQYELMPEAFACVYDNIEEGMDALFEYDYLILWDCDTKMRELLEEREIWAKSTAADTDITQGVVLDLGEIDA